MLLQLTAWVSAEDYLVFFTPEGKKADASVTLVEVGENLPASPSQRSDPEFSSTSTLIPLPPDTCAGHLDYKASSEARENSKKRQRSEVSVRIASNHQPSPVLMLVSGSRCRRVRGDQSPEKATGRHAQSTKSSQSHTIGNRARAQTTTTIHRTVATEARAGEKKGWIWVS